MMNIRSITAAPIFDILGESATYTPAGGSAVSVTVIEEQEQELLPGTFESKASERRHIFAFDTSEVSLPARGASLVVGSDTYKVVSAPLPGSDSALVKVYCARA